MRSATIMVLAAAAMVLAAPARAQMPPINMAPQDKQMTSEEIEKQKEVDRAYREAIKKLPDQQRSNDPWGNIRSVDQSAQKPAATKPAAAKSTAPKSAAKPARPKNADVQTQAVR
jgi:hypothetical protein